MTRERRELMKKMERLSLMEEADIKLGCGMFVRETHEAFAPLYNRLREQMSATYGRTIIEHERHVYERQMNAFEAGKISWMPCIGSLF